MKRSAPLRRSPFPRAGQRAFVRPEREARAVTRLYREPAPFVLGPVTPVPKEEPVRSLAYRQAVASLPCWRCGIVGYSQAAHGDEGKGMGIKACDLTCYPACGPHDGIPGCHYLIGSTGTLTRDERRAMEQQAAHDTKVALIARAGGDPKLWALLIDVGVAL